MPRRPTETQLVAREVELMRATLASLPDGHQIFTLARAVVSLGRHIAEFGYTDEHYEAFLIAWASLLESCRKHVN